MPLQAKNDQFVKDERWAIKVFRPLLRSLKVQSIPLSPDFTVVHLADRREWVVQGMGKCVVVIEQNDLPGDVGGILITSYDAEFDYFTLHILINSKFCNKTTLKDRILQKLIAVHEFTHTVAALSAISRIRSKELIKRLKSIFQQKAHALYLRDIQQLAAELKNSFPIEFGTSKKTTKTTQFPDEHYRLGFEDFPVSYPIIFKEFLLSKELFEEYFSPQTIDAMCKTLKKNVSKYTTIVTPICQKLSEEKALDIDFVIPQVSKFFLPSYVQYVSQKK